MGSETTIGTIRGEVMKYDGSMVKGKSKKCKRDDRQDHERRRTTLLHRVREMCNMYRLCYNLQSKMYYQYLCDKDSGEKVTMSANTLRDMSLCKNGHEAIDDKHAKRSRLINDGLPSAVMDNVHIHVVGNYKAAMANGHKIDGPFIMRKRDKKWMMKVTTNGWGITTDNEINILPRTLGISENIFDDHDMAIIKSMRITPTITITIQGKKIILDVPMEQHIVPNICTKVTAFDPGLRSFIVTAASDGKLHEYGQEIIDKARVMSNRILCHPITSDRDTSKNRRRHINNQKRAINRSKAKIDRQVNDIHCKLAKYLALTNRAIIASEIASFLARSQHGYNHYQQRFINHCNFIKRLKNACTRYDCLYLKTNEYHTSKSCSLCKDGYYDPGVSKTYTCPCCGGVIDRDANGARNILMRFLALTNKF